MGQALYRKYRSKSLSEIVGQDHITQTLKQALKQGRISHAYLFTGPRGVGKTSIARILAHEINNLEYGSDSASLDIIEIDAASNRRIDEIRELRDKVHIAPANAKYKVYIIDEVHMLTREAFNALLKTLEEPPEHAVFILATTDAHKLPETIVSRTQRFSFKPVPKDKVAQHLKEIAKHEKIAATSEALELLAAHGEGSFRDSISMLDQARSHAAKLDEQTVRQLLGIPSAEAIDSLLGALVNGESTELVAALENLYDQGFHASAVAKQISQVLRQHVLDGTSPVSREILFTLLSKLLTVPQSRDPERLLEIILLESLSESAPAQPTVSPTPPVKPKPQPVKKQPATPKDIAPEKEEVPARTKETPVEPKKALQQNTRQLTSEDWDKIIQRIKQRHNTLYGIIRMAEPEFSDTGEVNLIFAFAFHQKRFNETANQKAIALIVEEIIGSAVQISCTLDTNKQPKQPNDESLPPVPAEESPQKPEQITAISNIFGGGELLES